MIDPTEFGSLNSPRPYKREIDWQPWLGAAFIGLLVLAPIILFFWMRGAVVDEQVLKSAPSAPMYETHYK